MTTRKSLGKAIRWPEDEISSFLEVRPEDIDRLRLAWKKYAAPGLTELIDAQLRDNVLNDITSSP